MKLSYWCEKKTFRHSITGTVLCTGCWTACKCYEKKNIVSIFDAAASEIERALNIQYNTAYEKLLVEQSQTDKQKEIQEKLDKKIKEKEDIYAKYETEKNLLYSKYQESRGKIDNELDTLYIQQDEIDPYITIEEKRTLNELGFSANKKSQYNALMAIKDTPAHINKLEFPKIVQRFRNMFNLAVSSKEHRDILLKFYSVDWKGLGIDVPPELDIWNIEIKWGIITSDTKLLK